MSTNKTTKQKASLEKQVMLSISKWLKIMPQVVWSLRLNSGKINTKFNTWVQLAPKGTPDFIAVISSGGETHVLFIEAKSSVGKLTLEQKWFKEKVFGLKNIHHVVARNVDDVCKFINNI